MDPTFSLPPLHVALGAPIFATPGAVDIKTLDAQCLHPEAGPKPQLSGPLQVVQRNAEVLHKEIRRVGTQLQPANSAEAVERVVDWIIAGRNNACLVALDVRSALKSLDEHFGALLQIVPPSMRHPLDLPAHTIRKLDELIASLPESARPALSWLNRTGGLATIPPHATPDYMALLEADFGHAEACLAHMAGASVGTDDRVAFLHAMDNRFLGLLMGQADASEHATRRMESLGPCLDTFIRTLPAHRVPQLLCNGLHRNEGSSLDTYLSIATRASRIANAAEARAALREVAVVDLSTTQRSRLLRGISANLARLPGAWAELEPTCDAVARVVRDGIFGDEALAMLPPPAAPGRPQQIRPLNARETALQRFIDIEIERGVDLPSAARMLDWMHARSGSFQPMVTYDGLMRIDAAFGDHLQLAGPALRTEACLKTAEWSSTLAAIQHDVAELQRPPLAWLMNPPEACDLPEVHVGAPDYAVLFATSISADFGSAELHLRALEANAHQVDATTRRALLDHIDDTFVELLARQPAIQSVRVMATNRSQSLRPFVERLLGDLDVGQDRPLVCSELQLNAPAPVFETVWHLPGIDSSHAAQAALSNLGTSNKAGFMQGSLLWMIARKVADFPVRNEILLTLPALKAACNRLPNHHQPDLAFVESAAYGQAFNPA